jgi:hypothetical protein
MLPILFSLILLVGRFALQRKGRSEVNMKDLERFMQVLTEWLKEENTSKN